jgi:hypothetical protein
MATLSLATAFASRCGRCPRKNHLSLNHDCRKLSVRAVYRDLQDDIRRPTWTGTATPVSRPDTHARKIFVFDSIVVVRNSGWTLSPANRSAEIQYSDHQVGRGRTFYAEACKLGLEGIVSKRADAPYISGIEVYGLRRNA